MPAPRLIIAHYRTVLDRLGLSTLPGVRGYQGRPIDQHRDKRDIHRIVTHDDSGQPLILFMKRNYRPSRKEVLKNLLLRGQAWSPARQEWENSAALNSAGIPTAQLVAYGEGPDGFLRPFSFIITRAADGESTLDDFLHACHDPALRRRVLDELATMVRRMHDARLAAPDLYGRHIFVNSRAPRPAFCLIDMFRVDRGRIGPRLRARDLAALTASVRRTDVSDRERLRFLKTYAGRLDRDLLRRINRRIQHLVKRTKFREMQ